MPDSDILNASRDEAAHFLRCAGLDWPDPEPAELRAAVAVIAEFRAAQTVSDALRSRYEAARLWLKHIAAGRIPLPAVSPSSSSTVVAAAPVEDADHG